MALARRALARNDWLPVATALLRAAADPLRSLYEPGDLAWWSACDAEVARVEASAWYDARGRPAACLVLADEGASLAADLFRAPGLGRSAEADVLTPACGALAAAATAHGKPVEILAHPDDRVLGAALRTAGFVRDPSGDIVQTLRAATPEPGPPVLPAGLAWADAAGGRGPFPRAARRAARIAADLATVPGYDPGLDLAVLAADGAVAAHALGWYDAERRIGLFEPVRTEDAFQRRGLARALLAEGLRRMAARGATWVKVGHRADNAPAAALYADAGFGAVFVKQDYRCDGGG